MSFIASNLTSLRIFNGIGEEGAEVVNNELNAGYHTLNFSAGNLKSGIYFYRIVAGEFVQTNKMLFGEIDCYV